MQGEQTTSISQRYHLNIKMSSYRYRNFHFKDKMNQLVQQRCNSSALAMELRLSCIDPSRWSHRYIIFIMEIPILPYLGRQSLYWNKAQDSYDQTVTDPQCNDVAWSPWVNSVLPYVWPEVFLDVSLLYDKCSSGISLMYDTHSSGICLMYELLCT